MSESFGARLRQRRERQQIALATIAQQTKIKASLLEELERDDISHWPVGIFRRSFLRSYAVAIGLEPNVVLQEFLALHPDADSLPAESPDLLAEIARARGVRPPTRLQVLVGSALGSLSRGRETVADVSLIAAPARFEPDLQATAPAPFELDLPATAPMPFEPDLLAAARLCTELSRADGTSVVESLLPEAARILEAVGLIIWVWDPKCSELRPALAHGYPDKMLAQLPTVTRDADNATAAAFRSAHTCVVNGSDRANGAVVVPLMTPDGCAGVLAIELQNGREQPESMHALATIIAAQLARSIRLERSEEASDRKLA